MKLLEVEGARARVPRSWRRHCLLVGPIATPWFIRSCRVEDTYAPRQVSLVRRRNALLLSSGTCQFPLNLISLLCVISSSL